MASSPPPGIAANEERKQHGPHAVAHEESAGVRPLLPSAQRDVGRQMVEVVWCGGEHRLPLRRFAVDQRCPSDSAPPLGLPRPARRPVRRPTSMTSSPRSSPAYT